jgi:uncharacterized protein with ATP-grasp and redox domains
MPLPLMTSDPGSYARATIVQRKPQIIRQVLADNAYSSNIERALENYIQEIRSEKIKPLTEDHPDIDFWNHQLEPFLGRTWLEVPWYFAETFFYRRLLEAVKYFQPGKFQGINPFQAQKTRQIIGDITKLAPALSGFQQLSAEIAFETIFHSSLWGNRADLSNFTVKEQVNVGSTTQAERANILIDHTSEVYTVLSGGVNQVHFINDNVGADILFDLVLAEFLLSQHWAQEIVFHLKNQPFFVSDAMICDVTATVQLLLAQSDEEVRRLGRLLDSNIQSGVISLTDDAFWTSCLMFRQMPPRLLEPLSRADLVILKGDVNYRRLLDDFHWPPTTDFALVTSYFPATFVSLRTLKGEIIAGLKPGQAETIQAEDPEWLINGKRGLIHLVSRN